MIRRISVGCLLVIAASVTGNALAADEAAAQQQFFENRVRPVLIEHCYDCHMGDEPESNLNVDSLAGLLRGGERGPAIVPGKPVESLLISAVNHGEVLKMPPRQKLSRRAIADLTKWVQQGAHWPNAEPVEHVDRGQTGERERPAFTEEERSFWAFQPVTEPDVPKVDDIAWVRSPIDNFILSRLEAKGWSPVSPADKRALIRRATFDLIGLPPTPAEVDAFLADESPEAFARVVDRLLDSPQYGERWGRRWLDVARYADSNGLDENLAFANAYRYRDYVVRSFNADKPYDQFVREQLAGDLLPASDDPDVTLERLTATGFLSLGAKMLAEDDPVKMQMDIIDEQIDTVGRAFMGLTLGCARCHDHKFDPVHTEDYYALAGIFKSTQTMENFKVVARWLERPLATPAQVRQYEQHEQLIAEAKADLSNLTEQANVDLEQSLRRQIAQYLVAGSEYAQSRAVLSKLAASDAFDAGAFPDALLVEAESFDRGNLTRQTTGYGEGIGVIIGPGGLNFAEYDVAVAQPGTYFVAIRYAAAQSRPTQLLIDGKLIDAQVADEVTGSWYPDTQTWGAAGICTIEPGRTTIRLERDGPVPHIDKLLLIPQSATEAAAAQSDESTEPGINSERPQLHVGLVRVWADYLDATRDDPASVLSVWHRYVAGDSPAAIEDALGELPRELIDPAPTSPADLAERYQQIFDRTWEAWNQSLSSEAKESQATALDDPVQERFRQVLVAADGPLAVSDAADDSYYPAEVADELRRRRERVESLEQSRPQYEYAMAVTDAESPANVRVHYRGSHLTLGPEVTRGFPRMLASDATPPIKEGQSGRLQLAEWLTDRNHPLTARVMVNRVWQGHFGTGLVRSPDNFGRLGERPTHPELLDWLARRFVESGWSIKGLHRTIMLSSAYRMSTQYDSTMAAEDPENRLYWRMQRKRLEAEAIRDAILAVGGSLDLTMGGSQLPTENRKYVTSTANVNPIVYEGKRRSIYQPVVRSALYEVFQAFDFADPSVSGGKRETTTIAPQALFMMNSKLVAEQTEALATSLLADETLSDTDRIQQIYSVCYNRPASKDETERALRYVEQYAHAQETRGNDEPRAAELTAWQSLCRAVIASNEFVYVE